MNEIDQKLAALMDKIRESREDSILHQAFLLGYFRSAYQQLLFKLSEQDKEREYKQLEAFYNSIINAKKSTDEQK